MCLKSEDLARTKEWGFACFIFRDFFLQPSGRQSERNLEP